MTNDTSENTVTQKTYGLYDWKEEQRDKEKLLAAQQEADKLTEKIENEKEFSKLSIRSFTVLGVMALPFSVFLGGIAAVGNAAASPTTITLLAGASTVLALGGAASGYQIAKESIFLQNIKRMQEKGNLPECIELIEKNSRSMVQTFKDKISEMREKFSDNATNPDNKPTL